MGYWKEKMLQDEETGVNFVRGAKCLAPMRMAGCAVGASTLGRSCRTSKGALASGPERHGGWRSPGVPLLLCAPSPVRAFPYAEARLVPYLERRPADLRAMFASARAT